MRKDGGGLGRGPGRGMGGETTPKVIKKENDLISTLLNFIKKEKIKTTISKDSDTEFWLDNPDDSIVVKFVIDSVKREILYDVYSTDYEEHLKVDTIRDIEQQVFIVEENRKWKAVEGVEELWLILDEVEIWAQKNKFQIKEKEMI
ncbi:MAG: hypothetical protein DRO67_03300 [Candidatus Asgardarchaeum californiense]|nr:MAG: hypothetical protein DRO67_03300 [Candidatus Asgardarchaeum californiense]